MYIHHWMARVFQSVGDRPGNKDRFAPTKGRKNDINLVNTRYRIIVGDVCV